MNRVKPIVYQVRPALLVPAVLCIVAISLAVTVTVWAVIAVPFIVLASFCAAPNFNFADGFLAAVSMALGLAIAFFHREAGASIFLGTLASWILSCAEKAIRAVPVPPDARD